MKNITYVFLGILLIYGCEKFEWDLPRDNPLDQKNDSAMVEGLSLICSKYEVAYEDNNDGKVNKSETVYLRVYIKNNGTSTANGVTAKISTTSQYISQLSPIFLVLVFL